MKIDTLFKAQTRKKTPYSKGKTKTKQTANCARHKTNFYKISLLILVMDILVFTDHLFFVQVGIFALQF